MRVCKYMYMCKLYTYLCATCMWAPLKDKKGYLIPRVINGCEPPVLGVGIQALFLQGSCMSSQPLNHLASNQKLYFCAISSMAICFLRGILDFYLEFLTWLKIEN